MARLMTWKWTSTLRTFSTSRIQRDVIQQKGQSGSNQKSARSRTLAASALPSADLVRVEVTTSPFERAPARIRRRIDRLYKRNRKRLLVYSRILWPATTRLASVLSRRLAAGEPIVDTANVWLYHNRIRQRLTCVPTESVSA